MFEKRTYDTLKFVAQILLPALGTLYFTLAGLWGLPNPDEVVGTVVAVDTFLGVLLGLASKKYRKKNYGGEIVKGERPSFRFEKHPAEFPVGQEVHFKVTNETGEELT